MLLKSADRLCWALALQCVGEIENFKCRCRLQRMTRTFTQRVGAFLAEEFGHIADATLNRVSPASGDCTGLWGLCAAARTRVRADVVQRQHTNMVLLSFQTAGGSCGYP